MTTLGRKNPYLPELKTADDVRKFIERGGLFQKQNRIEKVFSRNFNLMRQKIHRVLSEDFENDDLSYHVYVNSILTDCRAMFLENPRYQFNSTLQSTYKARRLENLANEIDAVFNEVHQPANKKLREIIKSWVDKRVVHYDYLEPEEEHEIRNDIESILDRAVINNLFLKLLEISTHYSEVCDMLGKNAEEQLEKTLNWLTGDPPDAVDNNQENSAQNKNV